MPPPTKKKKSLAKVSKAIERTRPRVALTMDAQLLIKMSNRCASENVSLSRAIEKLVERHLAPPDGYHYRVGQPPEHSTIYHRHDDAANTGTITAVLPFKYEKEIPR